MSLVSEARERGEQVAAAILLFRKRGLFFFLRVIFVPHGGNQIIRCVLF